MNSFLSDLFNMVVLIISFNALVWVTIEFLKLIK